jgi:hypothetical protein
VLSLALCLVNAHEAMAQSTRAVPFAEELALPRNTYRGALDPDGHTFRFFRKVTPDQEDYRILESVLANGVWGTPREISFSAHHSDLYPATTPDGMRLIITSYRRVPGDTSVHPNANVWISDRSADVWTEPRPLPGAETWSNYDSAPVITASGTVYYTSTSPDWRHTETRMVTADGRSEPFEAFNRVRAAAPISVHACEFSPDERLAVCDATERDTTTGRDNVDLWWSERTGDVWSPLARVVGDVNTPLVENFAMFTADGRELIFVRDFSGWWRVSIHAIR